MDARTTARLIQIATPQLVTLEIADLIGSWGTELADPIARSAVCRLAASLLATPHVARLLLDGTALPYQVIPHLAQMCTRIAGLVRADHDPLFRSLAFGFAAVLERRTQRVERYRREAERLLGQRIAA